VTAIILSVLVTAGLAANGLRLRARVPAALPPAAAVPAAAVPAAAVPAAAVPAAGSAGECPGGWAWLTARGVTPGETAQRDAIGYAAAEGLSLVDLVPADLPVTAARDFLRRADPRAQRASRLAAGHSAGMAVLVTQALLDRCGASTPDRPEPADVIGAVRRIRPCAGESAAIALAPGLRAAAEDLAKRRARLRADGIIVPIHFALDVLPYALTVAALLTGWEWGLAAVAAYCLQPYLIFAGTGLRPRGLRAAALLRPVHTPAVWARTAAGRWRSATEQARDADLAQAAAYYRAALADGLGRFFEDRRPDCPWCGSAQLTVLLRSPDLAYRKPGRFTLERCGGCGHIFQNPRLTPEGLGFYYRDAYDGVLAEGAEGMFLLGGESYRGRARMLEPSGAPKAWLDVGTGHAHFCAVAREVWPDTVFDGLDQGAGIEEAARRGWIATAYRGMFPALADELAGRYDVISMHHYLEHTRDPGAELDAAARALPPGGQLLIELPDPQWPLGRVLRRYWMAWFQPQHQHMMPLRNLTGALAERGLRPVAVERGAAHQANDLTTAVLLFLARLTPRPAVPWSQRPPTAVTRACQGFIWTVGLPAIAAGLLADRTLIRALARRCDRGNAYRVLARKEAPGDAH
jgi:SAM-dependent methyltransferase